MDRSRFGPDTTASEAVAGIDLAGKTALVTGGSGGIGAEAARALASAGARVILAARDLAKAEDVAGSIRAATKSDRAEVVPLELASPASIRECADRVRSRHPRLDVLLNNAGVMACPLERTGEGFELQFATNHLGHFRLTSLLMPLLTASGAARVVSVSSAGHRLSPVVFEDIHFERRPYDKWSAYGQSKTANVLFAFELDRRFRFKGVRANALHPGAIRTDLGRHLKPEDVQALLARAPRGLLNWKSVEAGAATSVWAASAPELAEKGGLYLEDCHVGVPKESPEEPGGYCSWAMDAAAAERLWAASEEMLGQRFA